MRNETNTMDKREIYNLLALQGQLKKTATAYLLWFFLGALGIHKFYLKQTWTGLIYLAANFGGWIFLFMAWGVAGPGWEDVTITLIYLGCGLLAALTVALLVDLFSLPSQVNNCNQKMINKLNQ